MRTNNRLFRAAVCIAAFAVPAAVMLWAYAAMGMALWGDKTILMSDMSSQYVEFFCALKHGDLFFSWSKALGTSYIGVFSYYVSSPLSLLTLLVPNKAMPVGLMFLTVLKIGLAGLSFAIFAQRRFSGSGGAALLGAVCYALMSYNAAYSICIMWLDGVIWLPLILLALERILEGKGAGPFTAALTVCFFSTWYISYMTGIFCALYLCVRLVALGPDKQTLVKVLGRFFGGAACAMGLTAWMWLPTLLAMFNGKFSGGGVEYDGLLACGPLELLGQLRGGQFHSIGYGAPPYIFCGTAVLVLAALYFFLREFSRRERLANGALVLALAASMLLSPLDKVWHLFQRPNWFPFRYSFVFSFFLIYLAMGAMDAILSGLRGRRLWAGRAALVALGLFTVAELGGNAQYLLGRLEGQFVSASYQEYRDYYSANASLVSAAQADGGDGFFRMGATEDRGHNSPLSFGYPGLTHYSSLYNYDVNQLTKRLGFAQSWFWCACYGSTPVTDAFLDVKYVISRGEVPGYEPVAQAGEYTLWENPSVLPLAVLARGDGLALEGASPFERQNSLLGGLLGRQAAAFTPVTAAVSEGDGWTELAFIGDGLPVYADLSDMRYELVLVDGVPTVELGTSEAASIHYLGTPEPGALCTVTVWHQPGAAPDGERFLREYHAGVVSGAVDELDGTEILSVEKNGRVRLTARADSPRTLATTIPAEDGWTAYVDGKKTDTGRYLDTFLSLELEAGEHTVELRYTAPGLIPGAALGALAAAGLVLVIVWRRKRDISS